jgi:hypothetical protein
MIAVAVGGGMAIGSGFVFLWRHDRSGQLLALLVLSLGLAVAMAGAGAWVPAALEGLLLGGSGVAVLSALDSGSPGAQDSSAPRRPSSVTVPVVAAVLTFVALVGVGAATAAGFPGTSAAPSPGRVGAAFLLGSGVPVLGAVVLGAFLLVSAAVLIRRDLREVVDEQAEAARRRRLLEQRRRAEQRAAARAAARAQRRGGRG